MIYIYNFILYQTVPVLKLLYKHQHARYWWEPIVLLTNKIQKGINVDALNNENCNFFKASTSETKLTNETAALLFVYEIVSAPPTWYILEIPYGVLGKGSKGWGKVCVILISHPYQDLWWGESSLLYNWYVSIHTHQHFIFPGKLECKKDTTLVVAVVKYFSINFLGAVSFRIQSTLTINYHFINQLISIFCFC